MIDHLDYHYFRQPYYFAIHYLQGLPSLDWDSIPIGDGLLACQFEILHHYEKVGDCYEDLRFKLFAGLRSTCSSFRVHYCR